jgi:hypothetical protein
LNKIGIVIRGNEALPDMRDSQQLLPVSWEGKGRWMRGIYIAADYK